MVAALALARLLVMMCIPAAVLLVSEPANALLAIALTTVYGILISVDRS